MKDTKDPKDAAIQIILKYARSGMLKKKDPKSCQPDEAAGEHEDHEEHKPEEEDEDF